MAFEAFQELQNKFKDDCITIQNIYQNDSYLSELVKILYQKNSGLLKLSDVATLFNISGNSIKGKMQRLKLLDYFDIKTSYFEDLFKKFLDDNCIQYTQHYRAMKDPQSNNAREIDFLIGNIGFEINDMESHNIKNKDSMYHRDKTLLAKENGIQLIHIWEWELVNEELWDKLSNWVLNLLNAHKTHIYARKCEVRLVDKNEEKNFLNQYHLQGYQKSTTCLGLYYNNELVQLMSFCKPRFNKNYQYELLRLCTKYGYIITGGANKLLKHFVKQYQPQSIISYCSLDKFKGDVYKDIGFTLLKRNQPQIIWYNEETGKTFSHSSLNMKGADKLVGTNYGKGTNNEEIVIQNGYKKVYNSGLDVYVLEC